MSRYDNRRIFRNEEEIFENTFRARGVPLIRHYETPEMGYPSPGQMLTMHASTHVWKQGDRFFKLAYKYYGDSELWWIIAWFNKKPTEGHLRIGEVISIPLDLEDALLAYSRGA